MPTLGAGAETTAETMATLGAGVETTAKDVVKKHRMTPKTLEETPREAAVKPYR